MVPQTGNVDYKTTVEVSLTADNQGAVSLGIRINGSQVLVLSSSVTFPIPGARFTWTKTVGDIMTGSPSATPLNP